MIKARTLSDAISSASRKGWAFCFSSIYFSFTASYRCFQMEIVFSAEAGGTKYFSNGLYAAESGFAWTQGTHGQMRLAIGETTDDLQVVIKVSGIIGDSQSLTISAQGETLLDTILSPGEQELQFSIPQECVVDGVLVLDFAYPDAVSPQSIDPQTTDTRVLGIRLTSMTIAG